MRRIKGALLALVLLSAAALALTACGGETHTLTFDANGGTGQPAAVTVASGEYALAPVAPEKQGAFFAGWWTEREGGEQWLFEKNPVEHDLTLYAHWSGTAFEVSFDLKGHGGTPSAPQKVAAGQRAVQPKTPSAEGYAFKGWYEDAETTSLWDFSTQRVERDITLYAKWKETVTLTVRETETVRQTLTVEKGELPPAFTAEERAGYALGGWYLDDALTVPFEASEPLTENTAVYAKWLKEADASWFTYGENPRDPYGKGVAITGIKPEADVETLVIPKTLGGKPVQGLYIKTYSQDGPKQTALENVESLYLPTSFDWSYCVFDPAQDLFPNLLNYRAPSGFYASGRDSTRYFEEEGILYRIEKYDKFSDEDIYVAAIPSGRKGIVRLSARVNQARIEHCGAKLKGLLFTGPKLKSKYIYETIRFACFVVEEHYGAYKSNEDLDASFRDALYSDAYLGEDPDFVAVPYTDDNGERQGKKLVAYLGPDTDELRTPDFVPQSSEALVNRVTAIADNVLSANSFKRIIVSAGVTRVGAIYNESYSNESKLRAVIIENEAQAVELGYLSQNGSFRTVAPAATFDAYPNKDRVVERGSVGGDWIVHKFAAWDSEKQQNVEQYRLDYYIGTDKDIAIPQKLTVGGEELPVYHITLDRDTCPGDMESLTLNSKMDSVSVNSSLPNLKRVAVTGEPGRLYVEDGVLYARYSETKWNGTESVTVEQTDLLLYPAMREGGEFTVPAGVTQIGEFAFAAGNFTRVTMPESVTNIKYYAFYNFRVTSWTLALQGTAPPTIGYLYREPARIEVPARALAAYRVAWVDYADKLIGV